MPVQQCDPCRRRSCGSRRLPGTGCTVRQYLRIGKDSFIGMGAVVVRDVPPNAVMAGNPARKLKDRRITS